MSLGICWSTAWAQIPTQFQPLEIPALRPIYGQLISSPTTPQTPLQSLQSPPKINRPQTNQRRSREGSEFSEYQFNDRPTDQFEEPTSRNLILGAGVELGNQTGAGLGSGNSSLPPLEDPNFNGFTPRRSLPEGNFENQTGGLGLYDSQVWGEPENGTSQSENSLEQLPPAINETQNDRDGRSDKIIQRFPNGKKRIVRTVAQDKNGNFTNHGPWEAFDQKGNSVAAGVFTRGVLNGQWRRQHSKTEGGLFATKPFNQYQGPYLSVANFKSGKLNGQWTIYDRFRSKIFEITYVKGVRNGTATWWHPNRAKMREATFKDGLLDGEILGWDDAEKVTRREKYVEGRRISRHVTFYRPERPKQEEHFLDSKLEPAGEDSWWDAKPTPYLPRGSKVKNGGAAQWYENGQLKHQGQFKEGEPVGRFVWWHANGNKSTQGVYVDGKKARIWTWWHENGMKKTEGTYQDNQPAGIWRAWHNDGSLRNEVDFSTSESDQESTASEPPTEKPTQQLGASQSVIEPQPGSALPEIGDIEELPEELPQPIEQSPEETFSEPPIKQNVEQGPEEQFNLPRNDLFRPPSNTEPSKPDGQPASDPLGGSLFQSPRSRDFTTEKTENPPTFLNR